MRRLSGNWWGVFWGLGNDIKWLLRAKPLKLGVVSKQFRKTKMMQVGKNRMDVVKGIVFVQPEQFGKTVF